MTIPGAEVRLAGVRVERDAPGTSRPALAGVSLTVAPGERVFLIGPNGAGKTTLLLALVGAVAHAGDITIAGIAVTPRTLRAARDLTAFVFAEPADQLFTEEVSEEVAFGPRARGVGEDEVRRRVDEALARVGLQEARGRAPHALSLGEQRRLAIATALAVEPRLLLLDEPTASLDPRARRAVLRVLAELQSTTIVATHDLDAALSLGGRAVLLAEGAVLADGPAATLLCDATLLDRAGLDLPLCLAGQAHAVPRAGE